jgi:hypothetical protein
MDQNGEFGFDNIWIQARLEEEISDSINEAAGTTAIREHVTRFVAEWRTERNKAGR